MEGVGAVGEKLVVRDRGWEVHNVMSLGKRCGFLSYEWISGFLSGGEEVGERDVQEVGWCGGEVIIGDTKRSGSELLGYV